MTITPIFCDDCVAAKKKARDLLKHDAWKIQMKLVYTYPWDVMEAYCPHAFRRLKLNETNLELLERKYEDNLESK